MKVARVFAENYKRLSAVEIELSGGVTVITGKNGSGKTSVLDAIYVALVGRSAAPPRPVRKGEDKAVIRLDMGELVVTRTFTNKEGGQFTDSLKVENDQGLRYSSPQQVLDALLGAIGFDPFAFVNMKPDKQAEMLLDMVPLPVDLDELAEADESDRLKRRDVNRDIISLEGQLVGIPKEDVPEDLPDRTAIVTELAEAGNTNAEIERDRMQRAEDERSNLRGETNAAAKRGDARQWREEAAALVKRAEAAEREAAEIEEAVKVERERLAGLPALAMPVDIEEVRERLVAADAALAAAERQKRRAALAERLDALRTESKGYTDALATREKERREALAKAKMPIDGLAFEIPENGKPLVMFGGVPFEQASTAEQLRASIAIAMAANPTLRVLRISDGEKMDDEAWAVVQQMGIDDDYQMIVEAVRPLEGVGVIITMEDGAVKAAPAEAEAKPKKGKGPVPGAEPGKLV